MVIQSLRPYFTPDDVEKGSKWESEISQKLSECSIGIIILTKANLNSSWIMFEAGALSNKLDKTRVCPLLFGVENADVKGPLPTFQMTKFERADMFKLMANINAKCENSLPDNVLQTSFDTFWGGLEAQIAPIMKSSSAASNGKVVVRRSERDILEEILDLVRLSSRKADRILNEEVNPVVNPDSWNTIATFIKHNQRHWPAGTNLDMICAQFEDLHPEVAAFLGSRKRLENIIDTILRNTFSHSQHRAWQKSG